MNERIKKLTQKTLSGEMYVKPIKTNYDKCDLFLSPLKMSCKRLCEYIKNQEPLITDESCFTGVINFDGSVEGDVFSRIGPQKFRDGFGKFL
ncbi:MAG: hypothetical protein SOW78_10740 [Clostridia bacterium]|nr:hypothetical protein [Clostridia bacterium]